MDKTSVEAAVLRTILYGDVFDYPMTVEEIHHFLIHDRPVSLEVVLTALDSPVLRDCLTRQQGYVALADRADLIALRFTRAEIARALWTPALVWGERLARIPFVRMVGLTGALSMYNPDSLKDDLDYMLVTAEGRVWMARLFAILLVYIGRVRGVTLCPNYVLAENVLEQNKRDLYIAHEITQVIPVYGFDLYWRMRAVNPWTEAHLPNAAAPFYDDTERQPAGIWRRVKHGLEFVLGGMLGDRIETWERGRKLKRFERDLKKSRGAAELDDQRVKGHFNDHGQRVLDQYRERLHRYNL